MANTKKNISENEKRRTALAAIGIGFVCIVIGIPLWWKLTEVYRAYLPYSEISTFNKAQISTLIVLHVFCLNKTQDIKPVIQKLNELFVPFNNNNLKIVYDAIIDEDERFNVLYYSSKTINEFDDNLSINRKNDEKKLSLFIFPENSKLKKSHQYVIGASTSSIFAFGNILKNIPVIVNLTRNVLVNEEKLLTGILKKRNKATVSREEYKKNENLMSLQDVPFYEITFTLLNPQPDEIDISWNVPKAIHTYLNQFENEFKIFSIPLEIKSQYMYHTSLSVSPRRNKDQNGFYFPYTDLQLLINPIDTKLSSHLSKWPNLNLILYIPPKSQSPLFFKSIEGEIVDSFVNARWGGVAIFNVDFVNVTTTTVKPIVNLKSYQNKIMATFLKHLRILLDFENSNEKILDAKNVEFLPTNCITEWEMHRWVRQKTIENLASTGYTLFSLSELIGKIRNMVINDNIGKEVQRSLDYAKKSQTALNHDDLRSAISFSRKSFLSADNAFFDQSLLELLYFPEDQKFAIYIPLFLPIGIPVIMATYQAITYFKNVFNNEKKKKE